MKALAPRMPIRWAAGVALLLVYAPYSWLVIIDHPWNAELWHWIKMWPVLPGVVTVFLSVPVLPRSWRPPWTEVSFYLSASLLTVLILAAVAMGLNRSRGALWPVIAGVCVVSCFMGWAAYAMFRA